MRRKKEIIIIIFILIITLALVLIPIFTSRHNLNEADQNKNNDNYVTIKISGEISYPIDDELVCSFEKKYPKGITFGEISYSIMNFYTNYSLIEIDYKVRYFENSEIIIKSSCKDIDKVSEDNTGKICINKASKEELVSLYGIGEKRANIIITRRLKRPFESFMELKEALGVSDGVIEQIKNEAFL